jgi:hypothetical protein
MALRRKMSKRHEMSFQKRTSNGRVIKRCPPFAYNQGHTNENEVNTGDRPANPRQVDSRGR